MFDEKFFGGVIVCLICYIVCDFKNLKNVLNDVSKWVNKYGKINVWIWYENYNFYEKWKLWGFVCDNS